MEPLPMRACKMLTAEVHSAAKQPGRDGLMIPFKKNITLAIEAKMVPLMNQYLSLDLGKKERINQIVGMG